MRNTWCYLAAVLVFFSLSAVSFAAPSITSLSPTSGAVGASVTITGTNFGSPQGTSTVKFNTTTATTITSLSPTSGAVGAAVTITGTNFASTQGTGTVKFNGVAATVTSWGATSIKTTVPSGAT